VNAGPSLPCGGTYHVIGVMEHGFVRWPPVVTERPTLSMTAIDVQQGNGQATLTEQQSRGVLMINPVDGASQTNLPRLEPRDSARSAGESLLQVDLGGISADLLEQNQAIQIIIEALDRMKSWASSASTLITFIISLRVNTSKPVSEGPAGPRRSIFDG
jgi:hypothetical protein